MTPPRRLHPLVALVALLGAGCIAAPTRPGLPVASPGGIAGPVHEQRVVSVRDDRVEVVERVAVDGTPPTARRLVLDATGRVLEETPADPQAPLPPPGGAPLPLSLDDGELQARPRGDDWEVVLAGGPEDLPPAVLITVPRRRDTRLLGAHLGPGAHPRLAVAGFRSESGGIRIDGLRVLDLVRGRALRRVRAALEARAAGDDAAAEAALRAAWALDPTYADAAYHLAATLVARDRPEEAVTWLTRALALDRRRIAARLARDPAFDPLRDREDFREAAGPGSELPGLPGGP